MATQKPGEWANSLLARFEDQVIGVFVWKFSYIEFDGSSQKSKWHTHKHTHTSTESAKVKNAKRSSSRGTKNVRQFSMVIEKKIIWCVWGRWRRKCASEMDNPMFIVLGYFLFTFCCHWWGKFMNEIMVWMKMHVCFGIFLISTLSFSRNGVVGYWFVCL